MARRPSSWWSSRNVTNVFLPRTKNVGEPWLRRSVASGRSRQMRRISASAAAAVASSYTPRSVAEPEILTSAIDFSRIGGYRAPRGDHRPVGLRPRGAVRLDPRPFRLARRHVAAVFVVAIVGCVTAGDRLGPRRRRARRGVLVDGVPRVDRGLPQHLGGRSGRARRPAAGRVADAPRRRRHGRRHRPRRAGHRPVDQRGRSAPGRRPARRLARPRRAPSTASASSSPTPSAAAPASTPPSGHALPR